MATTNTDRFSGAYTSAAVPENLFTSPEDMNHGSWFKNRASTSDNTTTAPDGSMTADTLVEDGTAANNHVILQDQTPDGVSQYTLSVYAKAANRSWMRLNFGTPGFETTNGWFDITNGVLGTASATLEDHVITSVGNGWYRCSITATSIRKSKGSHRISVGDADDSPIFDGLSQDSFYLWFPKFEIGAAPSSITTVGVTRTDRHGGSPASIMDDRFDNGYLILQTGGFLLLQTGGKLELQGP